MKKAALMSAADDAREGFVALALRWSY